MSEWITNELPAYEKALLKAENIDKSGKEV